MLEGKRIEELRLTSWNEFPAALERLAELQRADSDRRFLEPLFRGLGNSKWKLETTLERSSDADFQETLLGYYRAIARSKPTVESLTKRNWDPIPDLRSFERLLREDETETADWIDQTLSKNPAIYEYLIYLRHHGFPSPLLDWTASPYIAAMFAFDAMDRDAEEVLIYAYIRGSFQMFGNNAHLFIVGPYLRTHPRHYLQQSRYSLCLQRQVIDFQVDYCFLPHTEVITGTIWNKDLIVKIFIPATERKQALLQLDSMNINPYSLYGSEESLIRTMARREMLFKKEF